jgi:hypothetical protein
MERRSLLKNLSAAAAAGAVAKLGGGRTLSAEAASGVVKTMGNGGPLAQAKDAARRGMPPLKITDVKIIATAPSGSNWTIVKVETSEPGLYGVWVFRCINCSVEKFVPPCRSTATPLLSRKAN